MKYENREKINGLCNVIDRSENLLVAITNPENIKIKTRAESYVEISISGENETFILDDPKSKTTSEFKNEMTGIIKQGIENIKKELEKL